MSLLAIAILALTPQQQAEQKAYDNQITQWVEEHQSEIRREIDRLDRIKALTYDQAIIVYDQCLARAAASLDEVSPDDVFGRAQRMCLALRGELLTGRPSAWFLGFNELDAAKRAAFPALTRKLRERLGTAAAVAEPMRQPN